jgi:hypothetical protein
MRLILITAALCVASAAGAGERPAPNATSAGKDAVAQTASPRTLYVCDTSNLTRRAFAREYGSAEYVTAAEATAKGQSWAAPKCITPAEARRLQARTLAAK